MSWEIRSIGDVCTLEKGNIGITKAIDGEYPLVVLGEDRKTHNEFQFDDEAVVIPLVSSTGHGHRSMKRIHYQSGKFSVGNILCAVIPKDKSKLSAQYLYRYLDLNKEKELVSRMRGMANVSLPMKSIAKVEIPIPPIEVQYDIVSRFEALETSNYILLEEQTHQLDLLRKLRQQILQDAVHGRLVPQDPNDEPASKLLERIKAEKEKLVREKKVKKEKPLPPIKPEEIPFEIPENWVWCRLGELIDLQMGQSPEGHTYNNKGNGLPFYQGKKEFGIRYPQGISVWCSSPKRISEPNDILISVRAPVGDVNISDKNYAIGRGLSIIRPISKLVYNLYLFHYLNCIKRNWQSKGSFFDAINKDTIQERLISLPPSHEQEIIVFKIEHLMTLCDELEQSIQQNQKYTQELLQVALKEALEPKIN